MRAQEQEALLDQPGLAAGPQARKAQWDPQAPQGLACPVPQVPQAQHQPCPEQQAPPVPHQLCPEQRALQDQWAQLEQHQLCLEQRALQDQWAQPVQHQLCLEQRALQEQWAQQEPQEFFRRPKSRSSCRTTRFLAGAP